MQASLSDQTMLLAENKNLNPDYELISMVSDGPLTQVSIAKNGNETSSELNEYASSTAFKKIWGEYFDSKFNSFSDEVIEAEITLEDLFIRNKIGTSMAGTFLTGNTQYNAEAVAVVSVTVTYKGEEFGSRFEVSSSEYNETQTSNVGGVTFTSSETNPMQQKAVLLEDAINKSVIQFDNFITSVMNAD
jgi:hypothetical protein